MPAPTIPRLPYVHLNLRRNPFGELTTEEWTALADVDVKPLLPVLRISHTAIQFIGEKGYGKTTHLLAIRSHFESAGYVHLPEGERRRIPAGAPLLIDEAQRLTIWQRFQQFRSRVPLVLGTHRDFETSLRRAGRSVITIQVAERMNAQRLHRLLNARISAARRQSGPIPTVSLKSAQNLQEAFGPDIRQIIHQLYRRTQRLQSIGELSGDRDGDG
ncbi:MAG: hypothetical protein ABGZ35_01475 [Planctomycetaceae bacterium]